MHKTLVTTQLKDSLRHPVSVFEWNIPYRNSTQIDAFIHWFGDTNLGLECLEYGWPLHIQRCERGMVQFGFNGS